MTTLSFNKARRVLLISAVVLMSCSASDFNTLAQEKRFPQTAGVDDSKMGPYRALAQVSYAASQKGDNALAAKLARILERNWDKAEDYGGETALSKTNHALFDEIDKAMERAGDPRNHKT